MFDDNFANRIPEIAASELGLTKIDSVDEELMELAKLEVEEELATSGLAGAAVIPVSALRGDGLDELRAALDELARSGVSTVSRPRPAIAVIANRPISSVSTELRKVKPSRL